MAGCRGGAGRACEVLAERGAAVVAVRSELAAYHPPPPRKWPATEPSVPGLSGTSAKTRGVWLVSPPGPAPR